MSRPARAPESLPDATFPAARGPGASGSRGKRGRARAAPKAKAAGPTKVPGPRHMHLGDVLKVERRYVVDGSLTSVTDEGRFKGVQLLGSTEHLLLEDAKTDGVRMIPLHTISEILVVRSEAPARADAFDPSFA